MDNKKGALQKLIERKKKDKDKKPQTQREYNMQSIKLFSKATSIIKAPAIEFKDDTDLFERLSFHDFFQFNSKKYTEENCRKAIKLFQNSYRNLNQNQFFIQFLMQLEPFNQIISESASSEAEDIIRLLSFTLKYEYVPKETPIFQFGEYSNKFYLILNGQVDIIVPNEEEIELSEEEYFLYLLKLRQFKEHHLLNKVLVKNCNAFFLEEKNFDNWVKIAYNTLMSIKATQAHFQSIRNNDQCNDNNSNAQGELINRAATFSKPNWNTSNNSTYLLSPIKNSSRQAQIKHSPGRFSPNKNSSPKFSPKRKRRQSITHQDTNSKKQIFDSNERRELVLSLESDIVNAMRVVDPYFEDEFLLDKNSIPNQAIVSTEEYINRTKPIKIYNYFYVKKKKVTISSYFLANRLFSGDKFGEMMNDVNQINTHNQRVSTIITAHDSEFGVLDKEGYNKCLKDAYERIRKIKLNFLLQIKIFKKCNKSLFMKSFSNFFTKKTFQSQESLFNENTVQEDIMSVYFIRDGEFVAEWNKSLNDIDYITRALDYNWLLPSDDERKHNPALENFLKKKIHWKLQYFTENDVIGLNDALLDKKYLYTVKCSSSKATVYEIHWSFFKMVTALDPAISDNVKKFEMIQRNLMIKLLLKQKKHKLETFQKINKEIFENEFTYVKKRIIVSRKIQTTINHKSKRKCVIDFNKKREGNLNINDNDDNTTNQILNHHNIATTISNITFTNKDYSIKSKHPLILLKNSFYKNDHNKSLGLKERGKTNTERQKRDEAKYKGKDKESDNYLLNSNHQYIENASKTKDYCTTTLESEPKQARKKRITSELSPEFLLPIQKQSMTSKEAPSNLISKLPPSYLTKHQESKRDTIFHSLSKTIYQYNKNSRHYSSIDPKLYLLK